MKTALLKFASLVALTACFITAGCGGAAKTKMDTSELLAAFADADASLKSQVDAAAKSLNAGKLMEGTSALAKAAKEAHESLSETQKTALLGIVTQVQTIMAEDASRMDLNIHQAAQDLIAGMEGKEANRVGTTPDMVRPPQSTGE
ncbi:MAG: hypothetical protein AB7O66_11970 [Limisphaerales bacterium]